MLLLQGKAAGLSDDQLKNYVSKFGTDQELSALNDLSEQIMKRVTDSSQSYDDTMKMILTNIEKQTDEAISFIRSQTGLMAEDSVTGLANNLLLDGSSGVTPGDNTVTSAKIVDGTIVTADLADDAITSAKIADDAVGADQLASNAVVTASIVNDAVTADKIVDNIALPGNITTTGTLIPTGVLTANAGVVVDNITIDGTEIDLSSGDLTLDVAGANDEI